MGDARFVNVELVSEILLAELTSLATGSDSVSQCFSTSHAVTVDNISPYVKLIEDNMSPRISRKLRRKMKERRAYPEAGKTQTTQKWKNDVLVWKERNGYSYRTISEMLKSQYGVKCDHTAVRKTIATAQNTGAFVIELTKLSGVDPPIPTEKPTDELDEVVGKIPREERQWAASVLEAAMSRRVRQG